MFVHPVTEAMSVSCFFRNWILCLAEFFSFCFYHLCVYGCRFAFVSDLRGAHAQAGEVQKRGGVYANPPPYLVTFDLGSAAIGKWTKVCGPLLVRDEPSSDDAASSLLDESTQPHIIGDAAVAADGTILVTPPSLPPSLNIAVLTLLAPLCAPCLFSTPHRRTIRRRRSLAK